MVQWYFYIAMVAILSQLLLLFQVYRNYRYVTIKSKRKHPWYELRVLLIVPCKGLDSEFQENITSFFNQEYENYLLWFVVADESDAAYSELCKLKDQLSPSSKAHDVQVLVAGKIDGDTAGHSEAEMNHAGVESASRHCSQKIHNLLHCYDRMGDDVDVLAFADSDVCVRSDWLTHMVWPLRLFKSGATTGYRWFIPRRNNIASLALSAMNAKVAQFLGNTPFNQAWGGSMAIHVETFRRIGLDKIWPRVLSDDLSLTYAIKKARMKLFFVPACLVASYESTTWRKLFEFGRRQFLITRVSRPSTWCLALCGSLYSVLGLWGGAGLAGPGGDVLTVMIVTVWDEPSWCQGGCKGEHK